MNRKKFFELFDYVTNSSKSVFVNDFSGWGAAACIPGFSSFSSREGNGIRSETTGVAFEPQYETVRRGDHIQVQYRENGNLVKKVTLGNLFPDGVPVVIVTGSEALRKIAPMFKRRSEMMDWMHMVCDYVMLRASAAQPVPHYWENDMLTLARYLYENRPDKITDRSIYDKCVL